jgi:hypothetical protein
MFLKIFIVLFCSAIQNKKIFKIFYLSFNNYLNFNGNKKVKHSNTHNKKKTYNFLSTILR